MITFKTFEGYTLKSDPVQKVTQENQVVIFYYVPKTAIYHIQHWYGVVKNLNWNFVRMMKGWLTALFPSMKELIRS